MKWLELVRCWIVPVIAIGGVIALLTGGLRSILIGPLETSIESLVTSLTTRIEKIETSIESLVTRVEKIETSIEEIRGDIKVINYALTNHVESRFDRIEARLDRIEAKIEDRKE
jgi:chromosome segregation ATPase